uniref:DNA alkylation repair enzyme n=1 Tax=Candidatus Kentrum sp. MB TaxID=2138164 RepID=A0A450XUK3_9GAMM|nr:MAG: DNA alkylation repair enzyme [Candidatus Kentron sp. MB]VFK35755.1 MAG: DNA alkylation repair enzyme [Candidatus Kentron sp. MB]VFK77350.1 MAG: DNA alkylation repair enzyme [Candidatus Kentron sp. MB]
MSLAIVLAALHIKIFHASDVTGTFSRWIDECQTWDHIDELCIRVTGVLVLKDISMWQVIEEWSRSEHMWKRRASLISHLPSIRIMQPSIKLIERTCHALALEQEFFIRKAIGWILRELADYDSESMASVFRQIGGELSNLSRKEATRKLEPALREDLLNIRKNT